LLCLLAARPWGHATVYHARRRDRPRVVTASMPSRRNAHRAGHKRLAMTAMGFCGTAAAGHAGAPGAAAVPGGARW